MVEREKGRYLNAADRPARADVALGIRMNEQTGTTRDADELERRPNFCGNCGAELLGNHCYRCGQPVKGLVRHFSSIIGDFFDSVFELDGRIWRTLPPLLFRPGFLSNEYFAGRRVRYVSPVRLMVFLSLLAFFVAQLAIDVEGNIDTDSDITRATSVEQVEQIRDEALADLARARAETEGAPGVGAGLAAAERAVTEQASRRIAELSGESSAPVEAAKPRISFGSEPWDRDTNPIVIDWLGATGNAWLNRQVARAEGNIARVQEDPNLLKDAVLGALPATLLVLLPLFALMLKLGYPFKRRLYMEHLIVALHSHAFLCAALLLAMLFDLAAGISPWLGWLSHVETALFVWMPLYLLLMQKRVYGQGWLMTTFKYVLVGSAYLTLLSLGVTAAILASLVAL